MKKLSIGYLCVLSVLALCQVAEAYDVLKFRTTTLQARAYTYWRFSAASRTIQSGDCIEYDVYLNNNVAGLGGIDIRNSDNGYWRDSPGWADQNGILGHPASDLTGRAYKKWYHRILQVPPSMVGKTTNRWDLVLDGNDYGVWECYSAIYDNIKITNGGSTVLSLYSDGSAAANAQDFVLTGSINSTNMLAETPRRSNIQVSSFLFYWYDCAADPANYDSQMIFDPYGLQGHPWSGYGSNGYYSSRNMDWWEGVFQDMKRAGIDVASLICWGDVPGEPWFQSSVLRDYMVPALDRSGVGTKIAMFDDTTSETCLWNHNNGRGWQADNLMPLSNQANWQYFYDLKIKQFFQAIPQKYWATHNGLPLEQGGRPVIYTYHCYWFTDVNTFGNALWQWVKTRFASDFKDANGNGITPFLIHESSWFGNGAGTYADGRYSWGAAVGGPYMFSVGGYYTSGIGAGYDDRVIRTPGTYKDRQRQQTLTSWFNGSYSSRRVWDCSMLTVETWNELWEGSGIERCYNYPDPWNPGTYLSETFYIDYLHNLVQSSIGIRDNDATFLRTWEIPTNLNHMGNSIAVNVRNDGYLAWEPGTHSLGGRLLDPTTGAVIPGTERGLAAVPSETLSGSERQIIFTVPADWPAGSYNLQLDIMQGATWFSSMGDTPVTRAVTVTRPKPSVTDDGISTADPTQLHFAWALDNPGFMIAGYRYAVGTSPADPGSGYLLGWTDAGLQQATTVTGLSLDDGLTYYGYVQVRNQSGIWSDVGVSDGITANLTAPGPITNLTATPGNKQIALSWTNPSANDFTGAIVRYSIDGYPANESDGLFLVDRLALPGSGDGWVHYGLTPGVTYYYSVFAHDDANYAPGVHATAAAVDGMVVDWINETFDSYADGYLNDLKWTSLDPACARVQSAVAKGGAGKALLLDTIAAMGNNIASELVFTDKTTGYVYLSFDICQDAVGTTGQAIATITVFGPGASPWIGAETTQILIQKNRILASYGTGLYAVIATTQANLTWYNLRIGFNIDSRTMDIWLDGVSKVTGYAWRNGSPNGISSIVVESIRNTNLSAQKLYLDNLKMEPRLGVVAEVRDDGGWTPSLSKLHFGYDPVAYTSQYRYCVGTTSGGSQTRGWTVCGTSTDVVATELDLAENQTYYITVQCGDQNGNWGTIRTSNGIRVAPGLANIPAAKALADGMSNDVRALRGKLVSAVFPGYFFIQETSGPFGLKVTSSTVVAGGDRVDVCGVIKGAGAERYLDGTGSGVIVNSAGSVPCPVALTTASVGGAPLNSYTPGVFGGIGPNNIGLLARVSGEVTQIDPLGQYFYIDDGCSLADGTVSDLSPNDGIRVKGESALCSAGSYVAVTGVISCFSDSGVLKRQMLPSAIQILR